MITLEYFFRFNGRSVLFAFPFAHGVFAVTLRGGEKMVSRKFLEKVARRTRNYVRERRKYSIGENSRLSEMAVLIR